MNITDVRIERYVQGLLAGHDEAVLVDMEADAERRDFPIVGRMVGVTLEILARSIGAQRILELGSGFGYSAYWFSRAVGPHGELLLTDVDPANAQLAMDYLARAGLEGPMRFHVGDALEALRGTEGPFDVVFCDIDKHGYPKAWELARERIRPGGLFICDNTLGFGAGTVTEELEGRAGEWIGAIRQMNEAAFADDRYLANILPIRDGVLVALRIG